MLVHFHCVRTEFLLCLDWLAISLSRILVFRSISCQFDTSCNHFGTCLNWENASIRLAYRQTCPTPWLMIDMGGSNPLWVVLLSRQVALGCVRKLTEQAMSGQASKQHFSVFLLWVLALISFHHGLWYEAVNWNKPWPPKLLLAMVVNYSNSNPN